ncbi:helix-turn-helix domain-containing GNAT family N-acetyltransferase [Aquimarina gracilis]|uniref:Helix-turn-helix domain-containing GNAT family N-acetyltransferase n=1 Tax=Aquimarina gracilis TaxID=874422 RepID=A0ABU5ZWP3_9FLAO|nr:helix-turn-helix domain-containing GNAT family N-acetyltransferase [Aquimarina gracilis]MEB3346295.1 helix-turn-helix domain-containing GNAT family N-acetyltransferase [Aquimarina gracilis]
MNFFDNAGVMAIGTRLRMLSEKLTEDASRIYEMYEVALKPKWFPVFYVLSQNGQKSITTIANEIGHSHPSVSKIVREMVKEGILSEKKDSKDGRKNNIVLTARGKNIANQILEQYHDVEHAVQAMLDQSRHNMWQAIEEFEFLLEQKSMLKRVTEEKKQREALKVQIVNYEPKYHPFFKSINEDWINTHFVMEEADRRSLENPKEYILDKGGDILVALYDGEPAGVCALIKMNDPEYDYELAKMAVSSKAKGKGIGWLLGKAVENQARAMGARKIYLESNTILKPAINLYHKLGFKKVIGHTTPYKRCNIQMELEL